MGLRYLHEIARVASGVSRICLCAFALFVMNCQGSGEDLGGDSGGPGAGGAASTGAQTGVGGDLQGGGGGTIGGSGGEHEGSGGLGVAGGSGGNAAGGNAAGGNAAGGAGSTGCVSNEECSADLPVCDREGSCVECSGGKDCGSNACSKDGICVSQSNIVYVDANSGSTDADCGARDKPCQSLVTAAAQLSPDRPHLVALPDGATFVEEETVVLVGDVSLHANGAPLKSDAAPMISTEGTVLLAGLNIDRQFDFDPAIECSGGSLSVVDSSFFQSPLTIIANECSLEVAGSTFETVSSPVHSSCTECADLSFEITNSFFNSVTAGIYSSIPGSRIVGNIFYEVAVSTGQTLGVQLDGEGSVFAFNTIYESGACFQDGIVGCTGSDIVVTSNINYGTAYDQDACPELAFFECDGTRGNSISSTLAESAWTGDGNRVGDPLLTDPEGGDFSLQMGSPAIDLGDAAFAPARDYLGNPRTVGAAPDAGAIERQ